MLKVAQYAAQLEDYEKAISIYEQVLYTLHICKICVQYSNGSWQVASSCLDSSLLKYSAKEYFFRASLCHLSVDLLNATHALEKYSQQYPAFQDSREYKLVKVSSCNLSTSFQEICLCKVVLSRIVDKINVREQKTVKGIITAVQTPWNMRVQETVDVWSISR